MALHDYENPARKFEPNKLIELNKAWYLVGHVRGSASEKQILLTDIIKCRFVDESDDDECESNSD